MSIKLKQVFSGERLMEIHALYETAFPAGEKKPFSMIISGQETGLVEILSAEENDTFLGLAIMAKSGDRVLLDYFAIASERRGQGTGRKRRCSYNTYGKRHITLYPSFRLWR